MEQAIFKNAARTHQIEYREQKIKNISYNKYRTWLTDEDAINGRNFYSGFDIFENVIERYKIKFEKPLCRDIINKCSDMLRSEHIPFNLFIPFKKKKDFCKQVFDEILGNIKSIDKIEIEYAPSPKENYLNDKTSFDAYIEYTHTDNSKGIIAIEVKYTEKEYPLKKGSKQEKEINDEKGKYYSTTKECGIYKPNVIDKLKTDLFRQIWRNHLLVESILLFDKDKFKHAHSLIFYPKDNEHFAEAGKEYQEMLLDNKDSKFRVITFEDFIEKCKKYCPDNEFENWIDYLQERYIIG